jgi:hypothetical protein
VFDKGLIPTSRPELFTPESALNLGYEKRGFRQLRLTLRKRTFVQ